MAQTKAQLISGASSQSVTFNDATVSSINGGPIGGARNRIINGDMRIDQRNAGASVTPTTDGVFNVDRWQLRNTAASKFSAQQSSTAPAGFSKSLLITSLAATTPASGDFYAIQHTPEGYNVSDLDWGTANAKSVTLSFWVRSSLTGTFGGAISNSAYNRGYPFTYTISAANTFEYKSITIPGDTTGTWVKDNGAGMQMFWGLGVGSTNSGTAGSWAASGYITATGATSVVGTNGATFYITGAQLEAGSTATPFERRSYGQELALCQRYLPAYRATSGSNEDVGTGLCNSTTAAYFAYDFLVEPRVPPTGITVSSAGHFGAVNSAFSATTAFTGLTFSLASLKRALLSGTGSGSLTQGNATFVRSQNSGAYILFNGCEL